MAVMSTVSLGLRRNGRYASRSMITPRIAQIAMEIPMTTSPAQMDGVGKIAATFGAI